MGITISVATATILLLLGCAGSTGQAPSPSTTSVATATPRARAPATLDVPTLAPSPVTSFDPVLTQTVDLAVGDLASRLARDESEIEVLSASPVTWPDGSLGCPEPGMMYTQALVEGARVVLSVDNRSRVFVYHAGSDGQPFLCPSSEEDGGYDFVPPPGFDT